MTTRSQLIVRQLREGILEGEYPGGMHMNEIELAEALSVSRTPIRAALSTLAAEGLLHYTPNSGFVVQNFTAEDMERVFELRAHLTGLAARLAARNGLGDERAAGIQLLLAQARQVVDLGDWNAEISRIWAGFNDRFHNAIEAAAQNPHLELALRRTRDVPILREIRFRFIDPESLARNHYDHQQIFDAISHGQQGRAEALMVEHVYQNGRRVVLQWRQLEAHSRDPKSLDLAKDDRMPETIAPIGK